MPLSSLGSLAGVPTPAIDAIITLASTVNGVDYRTTGRQLSSIGLAGVAAADLGAHL